MHLRGCGPITDEETAAEDAAHKAHDRVLDEIAATPARSLRGLAAKARAVSIWPDQIEEDLAWSIVDDLLAMEGRAVS